MKAKTAAKGMGTLYRRKGNQEFPADADARQKAVKESPFYIRYSINGKQKRHVLLDESGNRIYDRATAEEAKLRILKPLLSRNKAEQMKEYVSALRDAEEEAAIAEKEARGSIPIERVWDEYMEAPDRPDTGKDTLKQYSYQFKKFADWLREHYPEAVTVADIDSTIAKEFAKSLIAEGRSSNTYNKYIGMLKLVFRVLGDEAGIESNPWERIQRKNHTAKGRESLSEEELKTVCEATEGEMRLLFAVGMYSGLRLKDCALLKWANVDVSKNEIVIIPSKIKRKNPNPTHIPIHPVLRNMLLEIPEGERKGYIMPEIAEVYEDRPDKVSRRIQKHFKKCGIQIHQPGTGPGTDSRAVVRVGFHSLRHTFVSLCRNANVPLSVVESLVGHSCPEMTRLYSHYSPEEATKAIESLPGFGNSVVVDVDTEPESDSDSFIKQKLESMNSKNWKTIKKEILENL